MSDLANWSDLGNTAIGDVTAPVNLPVGHYLAVFNGRPKLDKTKKGTLFAEFPIRLTEPMNDVDEEALGSSAGLGPRNKDSLTFYVTAASLYRLTDFGKAGGASDDMTVPELCEWIGEQDAEIVVEVSEQPNEKNPQRPHMRIDNAVWKGAYEG